jgi:hypothetical protein
MRTRFGLWCLVKLEWYKGPFDTLRDAQDAYTEARNWGAHTEIREWIDK